MILAKYSELLLKAAQTRQRLERELIQRVKAAVGEGASIRKEGGVLFIYCPDEKNAAARLLKVFGIASLSLCREMPLDFKQINAAAVELARRFPKGSSFAIRAKRAGTHSFTSEQLAAQVGKSVVDATGLRVNLDSPDNEIFVQVRGEKAFVSEKILPGARGMPIGTQGHLLAVLEGRESAVAAWLAMRRGNSLSLAFEKKNEEAKALARILEEWHAGKKLKVFEVEGDLFHEASLIASKEKADGLVLGERLKSAEGFKPASSPSSLQAYKPILLLSGGQIKEFEEKIGLEAFS